MTWSAWHFGVPWRMTSEVTEWDRPTRFVDEQVRGPFRRFHHEHRFRTADGGVVMVDVITMAAPLGPLGRLVERIGLGRHMKHLIRHRAGVIKAHAEGAVGRST